jgi:putative transcriptional regulator
MIPTHHPAPDVLSGHSIGELAWGESIVVRAHLSACRSCAANVARMEALQGQVLASARPSELEHGALARTLARLTEPPTQDLSREPPAPRRAPAWLPEDLADVHVRPRRWLGAGLWIAPIGERRRGARDRTYLLRAPAGSVLPSHSHDGSELLCVLRGAFLDERGRYSAGDFVRFRPNTNHRPKVDADGECICLITTEAPLRMFGLVGRVAQAITDI